jgi:ABC-2 type transport system ATP-binding protein
VSDPGQAGADAQPVISVRGVSKSFNGRAALRDVSFEVEPGELVAVIGPNGAGKTTLLSILADIQRADAGQIEVRGEVGWVPQQVALYRRLTVCENLRLFSHLDQVEDVDATVERMLDQTRLADRRDDQVATLSGGNQQRINIAIGLLSQPAVLLLDEPSTGLDPRQRERLWDFVLGLVGGGTTVIFSTHHLHEAGRYARGVLVLADGELLFAGSPEELRRAVPGPEASDFETAFVRYLRDRGH